jgi:sulfur carrier protein
VDQLIILEINGERRSLPAPGSMMDLLGFLGIAPDRIAVELNRRIIRRADWTATPVRDRDRIEIVQFVGGG